MIQAGLDKTIRDHQPTPTIILRDDGTATLTDFPLFTEKEDAFDYEWSGFQSLEARWEMIPAGVVASSVDGPTTSVFGVLFSECDPPLDSSTFTGEETIDGMIFTFYDGDQGQILGFRKTH